MKIEVLHKEDSVVNDTLLAGLRRYRNENMGNEETQPLSVVAKDDQGKIIGGVAGRCIYKNFLIEMVWIDDVVRGSGLGRRLMLQAEEQAKQRGCLVAQLDTLSFQAPQFYQKLGFEVVGTVPEFAGSPARYFMLKRYE